MKGLTPRKILSTGGVTDWVMVGVLAVFSMITVIYPTARAFYHLEIGYNEGWNVYNAQAAAHHLTLFYPKYSWTTVNYPMLSFYIVGHLSGIVGDYLLTGRLLSLLALGASCVFVCLIIHKLTRHWAPAIFGAFFCLALFCTQGLTYVGMDDPQMLAHPFFLAGLLLYLTGAPSTALIGVITFLFVLGGNVKHNLLAIPVSVTLDLFLTSRAKAARFILFSAVFLGASVMVNTLVGGPFFISKLLSPRLYVFSKPVKMFLSVYGLLNLPLAISVIWSTWRMRDRQWRVVSLYFFVSLLVDLTLAGGQGVAKNMLFDTFFAMAIIMGACLDYAWQAPIPSFARGSRWRFAAPLLLYSSMFFAFSQTGYADWPRALSQLPATQERFEADVTFLAAQPGPALCESLLRCYYAGKPFLFDPFNATTLVRFGKLNSKEIVEQIAEKRYGAIQTDVPVADPAGPRNERFPDDVLDAIGQYYVVSREDPACVFYVPRPELEAKASVGSHLFRGSLSGRRQ